jgi:hypothetical protein
MPFEAPASALDDGAATEEDGAGALELPEEAVSLPLHAVSDSAATAMTPIPATRSLVTKITPISGFGQFVRTVCCESFGAVVKTDWHPFG